MVTTPHMHWHCIRSNSAVTAVYLIKGNWIEVQNYIKKVFHCMRRVARGYMRDFTTDFPIHLTCNNLDSMRDQRKSALGCRWDGIWQNHTVLLKIDPSRIKWATSFAVISLVAIVMWATTVINQHFWPWLIGIVDVNRLYLNQPNQPACWC